jgi:hypothetical protein
MDAVLGGMCLGKVCSVVEFLPNLSILEVLLIINQLK